MMPIAALSRPSLPASLQRKRWAYLLVFLPLLLPWQGLWFGVLAGQPEWFSGWTLFVVFGLVPLLDAGLGRDELNPDEAQAAYLAQQPWYRVLTLLCLPAQLWSLLSGAVVASWIESDAALLGWVLSIGTVSSVMAITVAHELIHKNEKLDQAVGGILLASVCYGGFKVEHVRGHHVHVSTPADASSARYGETVYGFVLRAMWRNVSNAFRLESVRLRQKGLPVLSWHNEVLGWLALSTLFAGGFYLAFGGRGLLFFLGQSLVAVLLLETVNYIEHYGLHRRLLADGRYERVTHQHSWNASQRLSNLLLFHLQRHSDHHAFPKRRYQVLRHVDDSPQLPAGYPAMVVLAWLPPLWFSVMNPRVRAYYGGSPEPVSSQPGA